MLDYKLIENQTDLIKKSLERRGEGFHFLDLCLELLKERRTLIQKRDLLNKKSNQIAGEFRLAKGRGDTKALDLIALAGKENKVEISKVVQSLLGVESKLEHYVAQLPNILHDDVPKGLTSDDNVVIEEYVPNELKEYDRNHVQMLGTLFDSERAAKISGYGFAVLRGKLAKLERAIGQFFLDYHTKNGYEEVAVPYIVKADAMFGTGQLPKFKDDLYEASERSGNDKFLIPTAEVPLTNLYMNEIIPEEFLPIKMTALTPCFRAEAGAHGQEGVGLIRQHQFNKVELVNIVRPEEAEKAHNEMLNDVTSVLKVLELPYRVVILCGGDTSFAAHKCYDIEVWLPSQKNWREVSSVSQFETFQARRAKIRFKTGPKSKPQFVHTLNGSGLAVGRILVAIVENFYADGKIIIPKALRKYTSFDEINVAG